MQLLASRRLRLVLLLAVRLKVLIDRQSGLNLAIWMLTRAVHEPSIKFLLLAIQSQRTIQDL